MTRRELLVASTVAPLAGAAALKRPNIVLIVSDDQGFGDLSIHGNPLLKTPNLDRIAQEGVEFTQFHVNPVCSPTRSSLLTGRYYYRTGVVDTYLGRSMMYNDEVTIAEVLKAGGYSTGIFGSGIWEIIIRCGHRSRGLMKFWYMPEAASGSRLILQTATVTSIPS